MRGEQSSGRRQNAGDQQYHKKEHCYTSSIVKEEDSSSRYYNVSELHSISRSNCSYHHKQKLQQIQEIKMNSKLQIHQKFHKFIK